MPDNLDLTPAQSARLEGKELEDWKIVDWYPGASRDTAATPSDRDRGPILRSPRGQLRRMTTLGRLVPLHRR